MMGVTLIPFALSLSKGCSSLTPKDPKKRARLRQAQPERVADISAKYQQLPSVES